MGSPRPATFVSGDRKPDGSGTTSSNSFWPPNSFAILFSLSSDHFYNAIEATLAVLVHRFHRETRTASWRLQEAGFPKDLLGLGGGVVTSDIARDEHVAAEIEFGSAFINDNVRSDPRLPFGGLEESGNARELSHQGKKDLSYRMIAVS